MPDITAPLVNFATDQVGSYGALAVFLLMILESACIPVPSEAIMLYGGFLVGQGQESLWLMVAAGVAGNVIGSWIAYGVGRYKGREWALRWHWLHITPEAPRQRRPLVPALRRLGGAPLAMPPDRPHLHLAARRHRPDALLALHDPHPARLHPLGPGADARRPRGGRQLGAPAEQAALLRLRAGRWRSSAGSSGWWSGTAAAGGGRDGISPAAASDDPPAAG